jgi:hypothetical protein
MLAVGAINIIMFVGVFTANTWVRIYFLGFSVVDGNVF